MLSHRDPLVVDRALRALSSIGYGSTAVREQIERQLADGQPSVAIQAAACLGSGDDMRAVPALIARMSKGPAEVAGPALSALQRLTQVDFKTDADLTSHLAAYTTQVSLYARAIGEATGRPTRAVLLRV